jgi:hypothetical protein
LLKSGDPAFKALDVYPIKGESSSIYKYVYGRFGTVEQAKSSLPVVRKKFPEAFVVEVNGNEVKRVK